MQYNYRYNVHATLFDRYGVRDDHRIPSYTPNVKGSDLQSTLDNLQLHGVTGLPGSKMDIRIRDVTKYTQPGTCGECSDCNKNSMCRELVPVDPSNLFNFVKAALTSSLTARVESDPNNPGNAHLERYTKEALQFLTNLFDERYPRK